MKANSVCPWCRKEIGYSGVVVVNGQWLHQQCVEPYQAREVRRVVAQAQEIVQTARQLSDHGLSARLTPDTVARAVDNPAAVGYRKAACGHYTQHLMNANLGTSCPDCYDRMSGDS